MSSSHALCCLSSVKKQKHDFHFFLCSVYNKTIIRFSFCDIQAPVVKHEVSGYSAIEFLFLV